MFNEDEVAPDMSEDQEEAPVSTKKTDATTAAKFTARYREKFMWTKATKWLAYKNGRWVLDKTDKAHDAMKTWCTDTTKLSKALTYAASGTTFARNYDDFDMAHHELLNLKNGTFNFNTEILGPHNGYHLITKQGGQMYVDGAVCPQFEKHVSEWLGGNVEMIAYLRRWCGYLLTADMGEQAFLILYGGQGTGKSTFIRILYGVLGDYCQTADAEMFMSKKGDAGQPFELAKLKGARVVVASEIAKNKHLDTAKLKKMSGGDPITACFKNKDHFAFDPTFKVVFATNDKPHIDYADDATWIRTKPIEFAVTFRGDKSKEIKNLSDKLLAEEGPGILNWFLNGYREWKRIGLDHPTGVDAVVAEWRSDENVIGRFVTDCLEVCDTSAVTKNTVFARYKAWATENNENSRLPAVAFTKEMRALGFDDNSGKTMRYHGGASDRYWVGLKEKAEKDGFVVMS